MPSTFLNQLRMMFRTTTVNREVALANNFTYVNEEKISRSLICPICLDPLIDPQTHLTCENSFCNRCIRKLRQCPCCRASIINPQDLKVTSHVLRNILDELEVQCNVCKQRLCRGNFSSHIRSNCLQTSPVTNEEEEKLMKLPVDNSLDRQEIEKHLSNLYRRIHTLENELFELKKAIFIGLLVLATLATLLFFGSIFSYVILSFVSLVFTQWLPTFFETLTKLLFDFSPLITLFRIVFIGFYFFLICYKHRPSDVNLLTIIICLFIVVFNLVVLILHVIVNHFNFFFIISMICMLVKYCHLQIPNHDQILNFVHQFSNPHQRRRRSS